MMRAIARLKLSRPYLKFRERKKALARKLKLPRYLGSGHRCPVCGTHLRAFKPLWKSYRRQLEEHGYIYDLSVHETLNFEAFSCPACDASDRERLSALYLDDVFRARDENRRYRLVEFAPTPALRTKLKAYPFLDYRSADLNYRNVDDRIDITEMAPYGDGSVDIFLCSHVLEHVREDRKAMRELYRILKPGGFGIVLVPIVRGVDETQEDPAIDTPELQWKHYGMEDHLRQYGKRDFLNRLADAGFCVEQVGVEYFGEEAFRRAGIAANSVLYVVRKDAAP